MDNLPYHILIKTHVICIFFSHDVTSRNVSTLSICSMKIYLNYRSLLFEVPMMSIIPIICIIYQLSKQYITHGNIVIQTNSFLDNIYKINGKLLLTLN